MVFSKIKKNINYGFVAQLVEQLTLNQLVEGSSPSKPILLLKRSFIFDSNYKFSPNLRQFRGKFESYKQKVVS